MTKEEIVAVVAAHAGIPKTESGAIIDAFLDTITDALELGEEVRLGGFGVFEVQCRNARTGRNIKNNTPVYIPARKRPAFKPGKQLLKRF